MFDKYLIHTRFLPKKIDRYKNNFFVHFYIDFNIFKISNLDDKETPMHKFRYSHVSLLINEYIKAGKNLILQNSF